MTNEYRPRPNDRLVEPLFDGLEVGADADADAEQSLARAKFPWLLIVALLATALGLWFGA